MEYKTNKMLSNQIVSGSRLMGRKLFIFDTTPGYRTGRMRPIPEQRRAGLHWVFMTWSFSTALTCSCCSRVVTESAGSATLGRGGERKESRQLCVFSMVVSFGDVREALDDVIFALDLSALVASVLLDTIRTHTQTHRFSFSSAMDTGSLTSGRRTPQPARGWRPPCK